MSIKLCSNFLNHVPIYLRVPAFALPYFSKRNKFSTLNANNPMKERKINVDGININYLKVGTGEHPVLLLPGNMGTIWNDFGPQVKNLDRKKFTLIAWDPPGYGKSRPPERSFTDDYLQRDAITACNLMKLLGYTKFSLLGWSDGGNTSLILASMFPDNVRKMIGIAPHSYMTLEEVNIYRKLRNIDNWSEKMRTPVLAVYGDEYFRKACSGWVDMVERVYEKQNGDICRQSLVKIKCPTLIVYGNKDRLVVPEHPVYLKEHIAGARLEIFEDAGHTLHLRYPEKFNDLATRFLTE